MWDLPGPGLEPVSPALAGEFLTTAPPGKSCWKIFNLPRIRTRIWGWPWTILSKEWPKWRRPPAWRREDLGKGESGRNLLTEVSSFPFDFFHPLTVNHQKGLKQHLSGQAHDSGLLCGQGEVKGPRQLWKVGASRAPRPTRRGEVGKGVFAATVEKGSWPNLLCSTSTRAALFTSKILFDKRFPWKKKTCNNVNNPILIRITANTDRACTLRRHCARKHFHCIDFFLLH